MTTFSSLCTSDSSISYLKTTAKILHTSLTARHVRGRWTTDSSEVARPCQQLRQFFQRLLILPIKPIEFRTININNRNNLRPVSILLANECDTTYLPRLHNRHHNLTLTRPIARNMTRELLHILDQLRRSSRGSGAADSPVKGDGLTCYLALEGAENEARGVGRVSEVETSPVYG